MFMFEIMDPWVSVGFLGNLGKVSQGENPLKHIWFTIMCSAAQKPVSADEARGCYVCFISKTVCVNMFNPAT